MPNGKSDGVQASSANPWIFWCVIIVVVALDVASKAAAVYSLTPAYTPHEIIGNTVRFTLAYNPGAAFGLNVGSASRWIFTALTLIALGVLGSLYRATRNGDYLRVLEIGRAHV